MAQLECKQCHNCGAPLKKIGYGNEYVCEYCGARYEKKISFNDHVMLVQVEPGHIQTVAAEMAVPYSTLAFLGEKGAEEMVKDQLTHKIAVGLKDYILVQSDDDLVECTRVFQARLRVVDPKYRVRW